MVNDVLSNSSKALLRVGGRDGESNAISFDLFARMLQGLQQIALVLGHTAEGGDLSKRFAMNRQLRARYQLRLGVPLSGSFAAPVSVGPFSGVSAPPKLAGTDVLDQMYAIFGAVSKQSEQELLVILPQSDGRQRVLMSMYDFLPKREDSYTVALSRSGQVAMEVNYRGTAFIKVVLKHKTEELLTVPARIVALDSVRSRITIDIQDKGFYLESKISPIYENFLLSRYRKMIFVTGRYLLDDQNKIAQIEEITSLDDEDSVILDGTSSETSLNLESNGSMMKSQSNLETRKLHLPQQSFGSDGHLSELLVKLDALHNATDNEDEDYIAPSLHALSVTRRLLIGASQVLSNALPAGNICSDANGGIHVHWIGPERTVQLLLPIDNALPLYLYHQEGQGLSANHDLEADVSIDQLATWLKWFAKE